MKPHHQVKVADTVGILGGKRYVFYSRGVISLGADRGPRAPALGLTDLILSEVQPLEYNKICMGFNPRGGAWRPLSAPRSISFGVVCLKS